MVANDLHQLENHHLKMLDTIIRVGFIANTGSSFSDRLKNMLRYVQDYYQMVEFLTLDDLPAFKWEETEKKAIFLRDAFRTEHKNIETLIFKLS